MFGSIFSTFNSFNGRIFFLEVLEDLSFLKGEDEGSVPSSATNKRVVYTLKYGVFNYLRP